MEAIFLLSMLFFLLFIAVPIGLATGISTAVTIYIFSPTVPLQMLAQRSVSALASFPLLAIPFFIFAGNLMGGAGISRRLVELAESMVGAITGGLALITVMACTFFAAISGSSPATVSAIGSIMVGEMDKRGYAPSFSTAVAACAGTIGVLIPPSIPFVIYCIVAKTSIAKMFIAGIIPGLMFSAALMITAFFISKKRGYGGKKSAKPLGTALKEAFWALMAPVIILGGIYSGVFTPTEAAVVAIYYSIFVGVFIYKELSLKDIYECAYKSSLLNGITFYGLGYAIAFGVYLALERIPQNLVAWVTILTTSKFLILIILNVFFLFLGCFMDNIAATIILTPILLPLVTSIGMDPIQFGVLMTVNFAIGFVTPPVGANLSVASAISGEPIHIIAKESIPFIIAMLLCLAFVTYMPSVTLWLPKLLGGM